jgi:heterodisulfide reductase subunit C
MDITITHLNEEDIDDDKLHNNPTNVEEVKLPAKCINAQRVDICIKCATCTGEEPKESHSLGTQGIW